MKANTRQRGLLEQLVEMPCEGPRVLWSPIHQAGHQSMILVRLAKQ